MNDNTLTPDRYAGDEAWQDWFDICSVGGCPAAIQSPFSTPTSN